MDKKTLRKALSDSISQTDSYLQSHKSSLTEKRWVPCVCSNPGCKGWRMEHSGGVNPNHPGDGRTFPKSTTPQELIAIHESER